MTTTTTYTTYGDVRGTCGHRHHNLRTASACVSRDQRSCESVRGYSDREVYVLTDPSRVWRPGYGLTRPSLAQQEEIEARAESADGRLA